MRYYFQLKKILYLFVDEGNKPFITLNFMDSLAPYKNNECPIYLWDSVNKVLNYWCKKEILMKVPIKFLLKQKIIEKKPKKYKYMYCLTSKGIELTNIIFPYNAINPEKTYIIVISLDEAFTKIIELLSPSKINKKNFIKLLIDPNNIIKTQQYSYILIREKEEKLKKIFSKFPYLTYTDIKKNLLKNKIEEKFAEELKKRIQAYDNKIIHIKKLYEDFELWVNIFNKGKNTN